MPICRSAGFRLSGASSSPVEMICRPSGVTARRIGLRFLKDSRGPCALSIFQSRWPSARRQTEIEAQTSADARTTSRLPSREKTRLWIF